MANAAARRLSRRAWLSSNRSESSYFSRARPPVSGTRGGAGSRPARTAAGSSGASTMAGSVAHGVTSSMLAGPGFGPIDPRRLFTLDRQHLTRGGGGADQASSGHRASETVPRRWPRVGRRGVPLHKVAARGPRGLDPTDPQDRTDCSPRPWALRLISVVATLVRTLESLVYSRSARHFSTSIAGVCPQNRVWSTEPAGEFVGPFCWTERCVPPLQRGHGRRL